MSLADLQSVLSELEGRIEGQAASIDSLTTTLETKDEILNVSGWPVVSSHTATNLHRHSYTHSNRLRRLPGAIWFHG